MEYWLLCNQIKAPTVYYSLLTPAGTQCMYWCDTESVQFGLLGRYKKGSNWPWATFNTTEKVFLFLLQYYALFIIPRFFVTSFLFHIVYSSKILVNITMKLLILNYKIYGCLVSSFNACSTNKQIRLKTCEEKNEIFSIFIQI